MADTPDLDKQVQWLKKTGLAMPKHSARARLDASSYSRMANMPAAQRHGEILSASSVNRQVEDIEANNRLIRAMGAQRSLSKRSATSASGGGDTFAAIPRFYDPLEYWDLTGLPWNVADEGHRHKLHKWLRLYYATHYLVPLLIDIFTRFPLVGMDIESKDSSLAKFYEELFLDQLDYPQFFVGLGREYHLVGEAFSLGSFDENLGIWEREELINPEDVTIENFPLLGTRQLKLVPPEYLRKLCQSKSPPKEYKQLELNFPELIPYLRKNEHIPISEVLLKQIANKASDWDDHGTPMLLRGLRTLIHEEKLLASQDAIAERLYSPLILAKLGIMDLGDGEGPWVPSPDELEVFRDDMDIALSSDFRLLVYHFGLDVENVFGREQMPRLGDDFDRIERRIMNIFGISPNLLSAGSTATPYASSALQAEFLNQVLKTYQDYLKRHYKERAMVVAEAQGHYAYEKKGQQTRVPIMEEVVETDEEGNKRVVEKHKLMIPTLNFETFDLRDEASERQFLQTLRAMGVQIPDEKMMVGIKGEYKDMLDQYNEELVQKTLAQQEAKVKVYRALQDRNLPIPPDLKAEVESVLNKGPMPGGTPPQMPGGPGGPGGGATPGGMPNPTGPGGGEKMVMPPVPPGLMGPTGMGQGMGAPAISPSRGGPGQPGNGFAPPASFEQRPGMPQAPRLTKAAKDENEEDSEEALDKHESSKDNPAKPLRTIERTEDKTVERLPKAKNKKRYSLIDDESD